MNKQSSASASQSMNISQLKKSQMSKSFRTPKEDEMFKKVDEFDDSEEKKIKEEMEVYGQKSEFKKLWKYQTPVFALVTGTLFALVAGIVQPLAGVGMAGTLSTLTAPKNLIWILDGRDKRPAGDPDYENNWIKD